MVCDVRALYTVLANSPSVMNACLTHISVHAAEWGDIRMFLDFANLAGAALRNVELRIDSDINVNRKHALCHPIPRVAIGLTIKLHPFFITVLRSMALTTPNALSSFTLSIQCQFETWAGEEHADLTRDTLREYTQILSAHLDAFPGLTAVRLPADLEMVDAFVRVAQDIYRVWREEGIKAVEPHEAEQNRQVWVSLEDVLCGFRALERVEFALYETSTWPEEALPEEAKVGLKVALGGRLPRLSSSGIVQSVFEMFYPKRMFVYSTVY